MSDSVIIILGLISVQCCAIVFSIYSVEKAIKKTKEEMLSKIDELNKNILKKIMLVRNRFLIYIYFKTYL